MSVTRTIGPLHFEDLEPKRFEDLVRQLLYDFRLWRTLEATGRSGSDEGYDARAFEAVGSGSEFAEDEEDADAAALAAGLTDRRWLIQCKRERTIGPTALERHLGKIAPDEIEGLHGIIVAAACDFSKATRDKFRAWCAQQLIAEHYLWGKGEIEDQLFLPKYDHLLFAYFGFSLRIRQRSVRTELRSKLAMKRKAERIFDDKVREVFAEALWRDPTDDRYPYDPSPEDTQTKQRRWKFVHVVGLHPLGLEVATHSFFAYVADDRIAWDCVDKLDDGALEEPPNFAYLKERQRRSMRERIRHFWLNRVPEQNQALLIVKHLIRYEDILDIDESGDRRHQYPHIFTLDKAGQEEARSLRPSGRWLSPVQPVKEQRIKFFPDEFPEPEPQKID